MTKSNHWVDPVAGFQLKMQRVTVESSYQHDKLNALGIDPAALGGWVDPAFFIGLGIHAGIESGISAEGNVNMLTRLVVHRAPRLDEPMHVKGFIESVTEVPRGLRVSTHVQFETLEGELLISVPRESLKPVKRENSESNSGPGAGERPPPVVESTQSLSSVQHLKLEPEQTLGYSREGNAIHYEVEAALAAGFRAPIIGGGQGVHYLTQAFWQPGECMDWSIFFRRPIFWDDEMDIGQSANGDALALYRGDKVLTEVAVR